MNLVYKVNQEQLMELLYLVASKRPIFIWGSPGIGKSSIVEQFAKAIDMECVSLLGSQLAPEDIIGVPQIQEDVSVFLPPKMIAKKKPYVLFLDELNACSQEVQKAFYSLINEKRIGEYHLPEGSIVIGAGNRSQDNAIVKNMSSALINRMIHVELEVNVKQWLNWAYQNNLHEYVTGYIRQRPDHLYSNPPKTQDTYSTPRSWHMLSDALIEMGNDLNEEMLKVLAYGCLSNKHAGMFLAFVKQAKDINYLNDIIKGVKKWPQSLEERDVLYFLAQSFKAKLANELPINKQNLNNKTQFLVYRSKALIKELAYISQEIAQMVISSDEEVMLPEWFLLEIVRDLPRLIGDK